MHKTTVFAVLALTAMACSSEPETNTVDVGRGDVAVDTSTTDTTTTATDTGVATDTTVTETSTPDTDVPDTTPDTTTETSTPDTGTPDATPDGPSYGVISVLEVRIPADTSQNSGAVAAHFATSAWQTRATPTQTIGECELAPVDTTGTAYNPPQPSLDAGTITVDASQLHNLAPTPSGAGVRYNAVTQTEVFAPGMAVGVTASGGADVPAFSGTVMAPSDPTISSPSPSPGAEWGSSAMPLTVRWGGSSSGTSSVVISLVPISVDFSGDATVVGGTGVTCLVADSGSYTIPSEVMSRFTPGSGFANTALTVIRADEVLIHEGLAEVHLNASAAQTVVGILN